MPTKNERLSLVNDGEEVTAVKPPPPGLIRESKVVAVPGSGPIATARVDHDSLPTPIPVVTAARATLSLPRPPLPPVAPTPAAAAASLVARSTPAQPAARVPTPSAPMPAIARVSAPVPISTTLVAAYQRPVVDLVPFSPGAGAMSFATPAAAMFTSPAHSRAGLYAVLIALLAGGAGLVAWRQWSARSGRVEISTTPADAIVTVGSDTVARHSPFTLERPPGTYEISVSREGYQHTHRTIELLAGQEVVLAIGLAAAADAEGPPAPRDVVTPARPGPGQSAPRHGAAVTAATMARRPSAPAPAPAPTQAAQADPGIAAMLARSHPLRDLSGAEPAPASPAASAATAEAPAPTDIDINEEAAPAPAARATTTAAPAAPAAVAATSPVSPEIAGARTVPGRIAKAQLAIDPNAAEYRVTLPPSLARAEMKLSAVVKICVSAQGKVADVRLLRSADPAVDAQIPSVLSRWRFRPLLANGHAVPFCYVTQYEISER